MSDAQLEAEQIKPGSAKNETEQTSIEYKKSTKDGSLSATNTAANFSTKTKVTLIVPSVSCSIL